MRKLALFLILGLLPDTVALAFQQSTGVAGIPWGASEQDLQKKLFVKGCFDSDHVVLPSRYCTGKFTFHDTPVYGTFRFRNGGLVEVNLEFPSYQFKDMKRSFIEEYGFPTEERNEDMRTSAERRIDKGTPAGPLYTNEVVLWRGERVQINLTKYPTDRFSDSKAFIITTEEYIRQAR